MKTTRNNPSTINKFTPVQIDWNDTCGYMAWSEEPEITVLSVTSIGHFIEERDDSYVIAMDVCHHVKTPECNGWSVIPKGCVKSVKELRRK